MELEISESSQEWPIHFKTEEILLLDLMLPKEMRLTNEGPLDGSLLFDATRAQVIYKEMREGIRNLACVIKGLAKKKDMQS